MAEAPERKRGRKWAALAALGVAFFLGYALRSPETGDDGALAPGVEDHRHGAEESQKPSPMVWTCSMHPQIQLPNPGQCPICGMELIPLETGGGTEDEARGLRELTLTPAARKLAEVRVQAAERRPVSVRVRMVGKIAYDERRMASITAWVPGRLERLHVDFTGAEVREGAPMVTLYSPELYAAQSELIQAIRAHRQLQDSRLETLRTTAAQAVQSAKEKLHLWGLSAAQIDAVVQRGAPSSHVTLHAPMGGTVVHKSGIEGAYVKTGAEIYTIADLSHVWVNLEAYESDLPWIRRGDTVAFRVKSMPGKVFQGQVAFVDPYLDEKTRTVQVRLDAPNPGGRLKPGVFVEAELEAGWAGETPPLVIPASAPLITGRRAVVYVADPENEGTYEGREIVLGPRAGDFYVVRRGLTEGEQVVVQGNFKIDSAVQILARPSMMSPEGGAAAPVHHHGDSAAAQGAPPGAEPMGSLPEIVTHQLHRLLAVRDAISEALESGSSEDARAAFRDVAAAVEAVDASRLSGDALAAWYELSMLIQNDALLGSEAQDAAERDEAFRALSNHMDRVRSRFMLDHAAHPERAKPVNRES